VPSPSLTILQRVARGERAAVEQCIDAYGGLVWSLVRRMGPCGADADDLVQEVFIALWRGAGLYDPTRASEAVWVTAVARRRVIDARRKLARRGLPSELDESVPEPSPGQVERAAEADDVARAERALGELREEQRRVLELALKHGLTYEQVAARLALPLGTVKTHARRGLARVRERLGLGPRPAPAAAQGGVGS